MEKQPKLFKSLFRLTANERTPTDIELDDEISRLQWAFRMGYPLAKNIAKHKFKRFWKYRWKFALKRTVLAVLIAMLTYYASVWYYKYKANSRIIYVPLMQEIQNGLIINKNIISIPAERSDLTRDNLDYFASEFGIRNWYIVRQQIMIESGQDFSSDLCRIGHNLFGMKYPGQRETTAIGEYLGHAKYKHWVYSLYDYYLWQKLMLSSKKIGKDENYYQWLSRPPYKYAEDSTYAFKLQRMDWYR